MSTKTNQILDQVKPVSAAETAEFQDNGHILIRDILDRETAEHFREVISQAADKHNEEKRKLEDRDTYGKAFLQIMNLWRVVEHVTPYHDQAFFKVEGGGPTPWHQGHNHWPLDTNTTITLWMPLVDIPNPEMGMLTFATGSHKQHNVSDVIISDESEKTFSEY